MRLSNVLRSAKNIRCGGRTLIFFCPACKIAHSVYVDGDNTKGPQWTFNGDVDKPTFYPSIKLHWSEGVDIYDETDDKININERLCHLFIENGVIYFCNDCTHELKGKSVPMVEKYFE